MPCCSLGVERRDFIGKELASGRSERVVVFIEDAARADVHHGGSLMGER